MFLAFFARQVVTKDGFVLVMERVRSATPSQLPSSPVILQHGLFMSSGVFVCNERDSVAFALADSGCGWWWARCRV